MIEIAEIDGAHTAIVRDCLNASDTEAVAEVESLWLTPDTCEFRLSSSLHIPRLRTLYVAKCQQRMLDMVCMESLVNIETLVLADSEETVRSIFEIGVLGHLKSLKVRQQELTAEVADWIARQATVTSLALTDTNASDVTIGKLSCRMCLKRLDVFRTDVSLSQLDMFEGTFPRVRSLDVSETSVSTHSVATIKALFPALERFIAHNTQLSNADLAEIASWERLRVLDSNTPSVDFDKHQGEFWDL